MNKILITCFIVITVSFGLIYGILFNYKLYKPRFRKSKYVELPVFTEVVNWLVWIAVLLKVLITLLRK